METKLIHLSDLQSGVHITAVGADTPDKQELEAAIFNYILLRSFVADAGGMGFGRVLEKGACSFIDHIRIAGNT